MKSSFQYWIVTALTCSRFVFSIAIISLMWMGWLGIAGLCIISALITDWIDGPLARKWNVCTDFGRTTLEPLADTSVMMGIVIGAHLYGFIPLHIMLIVGVWHLTIDHFIKPRVWWKNRIILAQAVGMELAVICVGMYFLSHIANALAVVFLGSLPLIAYWKRFRIKGFVSWCIADPRKEK